MQRSNHFENSAPILRVEDMQRSLDYYVNVLGFNAAPWGDGYFTSVNRDSAGIYLCQKDQGQPRTWVWIGVEDAGALFEEYQSTGAKFVHPPRNFSWAYEFKVEDPDGHVLRFGSEPRDDMPIETP